MSDFFAAACNHHQTSLRQSSEKRNGGVTDDDIFSVRRRPHKAQLLRANVERHTKLLQKEAPRSIKHEDCCGYCERYCEGKISLRRQREIEAWTKTVNRSMQECQRSVAVLRKPARYPNYHPPGTATGEKGFRMVPTPKSLQRKQLDFSAHSLLLIKEAVAAVRISPHVSQESLNLQRDLRDNFNFECCYENVANGVTDWQDTETCKNVDNNSADFDDKLSVTESSSKEHDGSCCDSCSSVAATQGKGEMTSRFLIKTDRSAQFNRCPPTTPSGELQECDAADTEFANETGWCLVGHGYAPRPSSRQQNSRDKNGGKIDSLICVPEPLGVLQENCDGAETANGANKETSADCEQKNEVSDDKCVTERKTNSPHRANTPAPPSGPRESAEKNSQHPLNSPQSGK
ncbi:hypothetical protein LSAT2_006719, partial [Lamellibrachia satsuma]